MSPNVFEGRMSSNSFCIAAVSDGSSAFTSCCPVVAKPSINVSLLNTWLLDKDPMEVKARSKTNVTWFDPKDYNSWYGSFDICLRSINSACWLEKRKSISTAILFKPQSQHLNFYIQFLYAGIPAFLIGPALTTCVRSHHCFTSAGARTLENQERQRVGSSLAIEYW